jgi:dTDP-4-amino-4,6-dideoxygalactose transaminase
VPHARAPWDLPVTDSLAERFLNLPCGHFVDDDDIADIVGFLGFLSTNSARIGARLHEIGAK